MKRHDAFNQVIPDRHLLDGKIPFGDYLYRMAQWLDRMPLKVVDEEAMAEELEQLEAMGKTPNTAVRAAPKMKTVNPGKPLAALLMEFLGEDMEDEEFPKFRLKFGPEYRHPAIAGDEAMMQMRNVMSVIPLPLPSTFEASNAYDREVPQQFEGRKPLEVKST